MTAAGAPRPEMTACPRNTKWFRELVGWGLGEDQPGSLRSCRIESPVVQHATALITAAIGIPTIAKNLHEKGFPDVRQSVVRSVQAARRAQRVARGVAGSVRAGDRTARRRRR